MDADHPAKGVSFARRITKELIARSIHATSPWIARPITILDCRFDGAPRKGQTQGQECGEIRDLSGRLAAILAEPSPGTIYFKNVEQLDLAAQWLLCEHLDARKDGWSDPGGPRIIAATSFDLPGLCERGIFSEDLYYAISMARIESVPLRQMRTDIVALATVFITQAAHRYGREPVALERHLPYLLAHPWPGNVPELKNFAARLVLGLIDEACATPAPSALTEQVQWFERQVILHQLRSVGGNMKVASERLSVSKTTLYDKVGKYGIRVNETRREAA